MTMLSNDAELYDFFKDALNKATSSNTGTTLDAALAEVGWSDALAEEPHVAVSLLFELQGAANATSSALELVLATALGVSAGSVVLPALGGYAAPGTVVAGALNVHGLGLASARSATSVLVPAFDGDALVAVTVDASSLTLREVDGIDPKLELVEISGKGIVIASTQQISASWASIVDAGQVALAYELIGASRQMLTLAREHALSRIQFGKPISGFQAVRHKLAETLIAIETAAAAAEASWSNETPQAAPIAKALAGQGARTAAKHSQQVLAGMGFTAEHAFHHYMRRARVLDQLFGSAQTLTRELGEQILASGELPTFLPL